MGHNFNWFFCWEGGTFSFWTLGLWATVSVNKVLTTDGLKCNNSTDDYTDSHFSCKLRNTQNRNITNTCRCGLWHNNNYGKQNLGKSKFLFLRYISEWRKTKTTNTTVQTQRYCHDTDVHTPTPTHAQTHRFCRINCLMLCESSAPFLHKANEQLYIIYMYLWKQEENEDLFTWLQNSQN